MDAQFDPTGAAGPRDLADLYARFLLEFLWRPDVARRVRGGPHAGADPLSHRCDARTCAIFSCGNFHVCGATSDVHLCPDVYACDRRVTTRDGWVVCEVSGVAKPDDELDAVGAGGLVAYADEDAGGNGGGGGGGGTSVSRRRRHIDGYDADPASRERTALYKRARFCGDIDGDTVLVGGDVRRAIVGQRMCVSGLASVSAARDAPDGDAALREQQNELERESTAAWLCDVLVRKDAVAVVARRALASDVRWRKAANDYSNACLAARVPVCVTTLLSLKSAQRVGVLTWKRSYLSVPDAAVGVLRDWVAVRARLLWDMFRPWMRARARSARPATGDAQYLPLKYPHAYHVLAVMYCSRLGLREAPRATHSAGATGWLISRIPYLKALLPSQKDLSNYMLSKYSTTRIVKRTFTHTQRMTLNWLTRLTPSQRDALRSSDAHFMQRIRALPVPSSSANQQRPDPERPPGFD
jgi:hypothetical protein